MRRLVLWFLLAFCVPVSAEPVLTERPEAQSEPAGRSGFWTSPHPAKGGAYRWRMLAIGGVLAAATGYAMWRMMRKASAERARRTHDSRG